MQFLGKWTKTAAYALGLLLLASQLGGCGKKSDLTLPEQPQAKLAGLAEEAPQQ